MGDGEYCQPVSAGTIASTADWGNNGLTDTLCVGFDHPYYSCGLLCRYILLRNPRDGPHETYLRTVLHLSFHLFLCGALSCLILSSVTLWCALLLL